MKVGEVKGKSVVLNSGRLLPLLGFGTYQIPDDETGLAAIITAVGNGYRLLDCASFYRNEATVGKAIAKIPRDELYVVSKVWNDAIHAGPAAIRESCMQTIRELQCGYLDLYLIHWPVPGKHVEAYKELMKLRDEGMIRDIGVSNYTIEDFEELVASGIKDVPVVNQIEINPFLYRQKTIDFFLSKGVVPMSYRGLRNAAAFDHPVLTRIASSLNRTTAQVLGRWLIQKGICHIPKSLRKDRILSNGDLFSFSIPDADMQVLDSLTTAESLETFREHYLVRIVRDTPIEIDRERRITLA